LLNNIKNALEEAFNLPVHYGDLPFDPSEKEISWDFIVFARDESGMSGTSNIDCSRSYDVAIVCENYIPEDYDIKLIKTMKSIGLRPTKDPGGYSYTKKPNTDIIIEIYSKGFVRAYKGCDIFE